MKNFLRSILFIPCHRLEFIKKISDVKADAIAFDLEDGVPPKNKDLARKNLKAFLRQKQKKNVYVRVNSLDSNFLKEDLLNSIHPNLDGIIIPKISDKNDVKKIEKQVSTLEKSKKIKKKIKFLILIERAKAILEIKSIATCSKRIEGLIFGAEDYLSDLGVFELTSKRNIDYPRAIVAITAKAYKLVSIDTPFLNLSDRKGFLNHLKKSKSLGYNGMLNIHPDQCNITNASFFPNKQELKTYAEIATLTNKNIKTNSIFLRKNRMMGPPIVRLAKKLLNHYKNNFYEENS